MMARDSLGLLGEVRMHPFACSRCCAIMIFPEQETDGFCSLGEFSRSYEPEQVNQDGKLHEKSENEENTIRTKPWNKKRLSTTLRKCVQEVVAF